MSLKDARNKALTLKTEIAKGMDPRQYTAKSVPTTFAEFFTQHYMPYATPRKRTAAKDQQYFDLRLEKEFGHLPLNQISRKQIQSFHTKLRNEGLAATTANHYLKLLKSLLNLAVTWEMMEGKNPASKIPLYLEDNKVGNYLEKEELERLVSVLRTDDNRPVCLIALFL